MSSSAKPEGVDDLVTRACDGTVSEDDAEALFHEASHKDDVRAFLLQQVLIDRLLKAALGPPLDPGVVMRALPTGGHLLSSQTLADVRTQQTETPWLRPHSQVAPVKRLWRVRLAPGVTLAAVTAAALVSFELVRPRVQLQAVTQLTRDAWPSLPAQDKVQSTLTTSAVAPDDDVTASQLSGLAKGRVVLSQNFDKGSAQESGWEVGTTARCPPGAGVRRCLKSDRMNNPKYSQQFGVTLGNWHDVLFTLHCDAQPTGTTPRAHCRQGRACGHCISRSTGATTTCFFSPT